MAKEEKEKIKEEKERKKKKKKRREKVKKGQNRVKRVEKIRFNYKNKGMNNNCSRTSEESTPLEFIEPR